MSEQEIEWTQADVPESAYYAWTEKALDPAARVCILWLGKGVKVRRGCWRSVSPITPPAFTPPASKPASAGGAVLRPISLENVWDARGARTEIREFADIREHERQYTFSLEARLAGLEREVARLEGDLAAALARAEQAEAKVREMLGLSAESTPTSVAVDMIDRIDPDDAASWVKILRQYNARLTALESAQARGKGE